MPSRIPTIKFNTGETFPMFGLGTWKSKPGEVAQAVKHAIDLGYRHIDCAYIYENEKEVGEALRAKISENVVRRQDLYITSKLWNTFHRPNLVEPALKMTLKNLGLKYLDLFLIHWPFGFQENGKAFPYDASGKILFSDVDYVDTWKAMEASRVNGLTKNIGVSNFNSKQIERLLKSAQVVPVTNQIECHPYLNQKKLSELCKSNNIAITAYSPLGSKDRPWAKAGDKELLQDPKLKSIANKHKKSVAQIALRYQIQRGHIVIPKSVTKSRIQENFEIWDFELSTEDMEGINSLNCDIRYCPFPQYVMFTQIENILA